MTDNRAYQYPIVDKEVLEELGATNTSLTSGNFLNGLNHFGTDVFKSDLFHEILTGQKYHTIQIGHNTGLMLEADYYSGFRVHIDIGSKFENRDPDDTYDSVDTDYHYKVELTKDEINSVDNDRDRWKLLLEKTYEDVSQKIIPDAILQYETELVEKLNGIYAAKEKLNEINNTPKPTGSSFEM